MKTTAFEPLALKTVREIRLQIRHKYRKTWEQGITERCNQAY